MTDLLMTLRLIALQLPPKQRAEALAALDDAVATVLELHREIQHLNASLSFHLRATRGLAEKLKRAGGTP